MSEHDITVTVKASKSFAGTKVRGHLVDEIVARTLATALANVGAVDITASTSDINDFAGNGDSCDPDWMATLAALAKRGVRVFVMVEDDDG